MSDSLPTVLIVDDQPEDRQAIAALLDRERCRVVTAASGNEALRCALHEDFALIVIDANMPALDGFETVRLLLQRKSSVGAPMLIIIASSRSPQTALTAYHAGAVDFLVKPLDPDVFRAKVRVFLQLAEARLRLADEKLAREHLAAELREHAILQLAILDSANLAIFSTDLAGRVRTWNAGAERLLGWLATDTVGQIHAAQFLAVDAGTEAGREAGEWAALAAAAEAGRPAETELSCARLGCSRFPASLTLTALRNADDDATGFLVVVADNTARKQVDAARQRTEEALRQALDDLSRANDELGQTSKLKDEFLANMSHELRTPLNAILGLSEALLENTAGTLTPRQVKSVTTISTSGQHLLALINDILDLSKIEAGKLELNLDTVNVAEFCESCLVFVRTQAIHKHIGVAFEHDRRVAQLSADPKRLKQILVNLLTNAVKFTPEGGRIGLIVSAAAGEEAVRFTVWDSGIGIAAADAAKLFKAFTQIDSGLSRAQEGTGLGLALVAKLVELHGGSVTLESEPGKGSRFIVTLPLAAPSPGSAGVPPAGLGASPNPLVTYSVPPHPRMEELSRRRDSEDGTRDACAPKGTRDACAPSSFRRALIIEDDATAGEQLVRYLMELGLSSVVHVRGEESVKAALRERPDVILLDILLPDESGWVVLARLLEHPQTRDIPVVVVSVVDEPQKSRSLGAAAHFTKPVTREQLAGFLQRPTVKKAPPAPRPAPKAPTAGPVILLAEDNAANIQTVGGYLEDKGYAMTYATNGLVAVKLTRELRPGLLLMDIQMPVMDGLTAIREIRADAALKEIPIVALTALAMPGDRERCLAAGATDYLSKPVSLKALAALVARLLPATGEDVK